MSNHVNLMFIAFILTLAALQGTDAAAVKYNITNTAAETPGGTRFNNEIGFKYSRHILKSSSMFVWKIFQQKTKADRASVKLVSLFIDEMDGVAYRDHNEIHVSANYIAGYGSGLKLEFSGVIYHEMAHVWQWHGNDSTPEGLIEGIADFVRLKAGYAPSHWRKPGQGDKWDQGYDITAHFLDYCEGLKIGFVAELNKKMKRGYSDNYFVDLVGMTVNQLWCQYKAKYHR